MTTAPKGYVALTRSTDGKTFIVDARGLWVFPPAAEDAARKTCGVASVYYDDRGWTVAESFDEVCAKLAAALGEQGAAPESDAAQRAFAARVLKDADSAPKPAAADPTATERAAGTKALREAAKAIDGMTSCELDDFIHGPALWLRCRADDIERGDA